MSQANGKVNFDNHLLRDQVAVVTGGSRGIGRATAWRLAEAGADVVVNYLSQHEEAAITAAGVEARGRKALLVQADIAQGEQALMLAHRVAEHFKRADLLVANAGVWRGAAVEAMSEELWQQALSVNLTGTWTVCRAFVPLMKQQGRGSIVIVSSTAGQRGEAFYSNYAASKGGQISLTKALATELAPAIRVNCVAPGWVDTELSDSVFRDEDYKQKVAATIPLGRIATADDIAAPIVFLASELARHITGEVLNINGGSVLCG